MGKGPFFGPFFFFGAAPSALQAFGSGCALARYSLGPSLFSLRFKKLGLAFGH